MWHPTSGTPGMVVPPQPGRRNGSLSSAQPAFCLHPRSIPPSLQAGKTAAVANTSNSNDKSNTVLHQDNSTTDPDTGMATATLSLDTRHVPRRESSPRPRNNDRRRPRLLRACATEPSITTSNAGKGVLSLASPYTTHRASDLLSRVAVSNASSSPSSTRSSVLDSGEKREYRMSEASQNPHSACYFSFPSFDTWEEELQEEEKMERST